MKTYAPTYYKDFHCIADRCKHSCCIGWEIDIDCESYQKYQAVEGPFGERLRESIQPDGDAHIFCMTEDKRCRFLNPSGLCDIYSQLGEDALCGICKEHPRYFIFASYHMEAGLGLCCEEAGRLLFSETEPIEMTVVDEDQTCEEKLYQDEAFFFNTRESLYAIVQNRELNLPQRIRQLLTFCGIKLPRKTVAKWCEHYRGLERLDSDWENTLADWEAYGKMRLPRSKRDSICCEQLLFYFIHRQFSTGWEDERYYERVAFSVHAAYVISSMVAARRKKYGNHGIDDWVDIARQYSAEIEYSPDNEKIVLDLLAIHRLDKPGMIPECNFFDPLYYDDNDYGDLYRLDPDF